MALSPEQLEQFDREGWVLVRGLFDAAQMAELRAGFDHVEALARNHRQLPAPLLETDERPEEHGPNARRVYFHIQPPKGTPPDARYLRKVQWPALLHPGFEGIRTSPKFQELLRPHLGDDIRQYINQINFKMPRGDIEFPYHQDVRDGAVEEPISNYVQTYTLVDEATEDNGCLWVFPRSQKRLGNMKGQDLTEALDMETAVPVTGQPGDCLLFSTYTVHGSHPNTTDKPRRAYINGFLRADASLTPDCEWAFRDGAPVPLPSRYCPPPHVSAVTRRCDSLILRPSRQVRLRRAGFPEGLPSLSASSLVAARAPEQLPGPTRHERLARGVRGVPPPSGVDGLRAGGGEAGAGGGPGFLRPSSGAQARGRLP